MNKLSNAVLTGDAAANVLQCCCYTVVHKRCHLFWTI